MPATSRQQKYRPGASRSPVVADNFRQQMADVARAERLRSLRAETHLSREKAAGEIGVTTKTLYEWERGGNIRWENAKRVATFYGVEPESIVDREGGEDYAVVDVSELDEIKEKLDEVLKILKEVATEDDAKVTDSETAAAEDVRDSFQLEQDHRPAPRAEDEQG